MVTAFSSVMASVATAILFAGFSSGAQDITACITASCGDCRLLLAPLDSPSCQTYPITSFDENGFEALPSGGFAVYLSVPQPETDCQYIVGSGSGCGAVVGRYSSAVCSRLAVTSSVSLSYCCGDCDAEEIRLLENSQTTTDMAKRDCSTFTQDGGSYEVIGPSHKVSDTTIGPGHIDVSTTVETSRTTSFSGSIGDPWGVISETAGFEFTESKSQSLTYSFDLVEGQTGYVAWSPTMKCVRGTLSNCDNGVEESGEACTPKEDSSGNVVGTFNFVTTARALPVKHSARFVY